MNPLVIIPLVVGFIITLFSIPIWIKRSKNAGLIGKDMHSLEKKGVSSTGGVPVLIGFVIGVLSYIAIKTFYFQTTENLISTLSLLTSIFIISFVGLIDDILGWKIGLTKKIRIFLLIFAAIPLMVINAGDHQMMGIEFGILYPLILIPLGIVGASSAYNILAGYNGLESSQGILILSGLAFVAWKTGNGGIGVIALTMVACLISFYIFNKHPAKVFPGNILTYSIGALIAGVAILGNMEKIAVFFFIPYILETGLKLRGKLKKESFAKLNNDGSLEMPYEKIYGLEHLAIKMLKKIKKSGKVYEWEVVGVINAFQIIIIIAGLLLFL